MKTIKEQLEHAKKYGYPVRVTFKGCVRKGLITEVNDANFIMSVCNGAWHHYAAVVSVEPVEPEIAKHSHPHCDVAGCQGRHGGFFHCKRRECETRMIFVDYAGSFREDADPKSAEEPKENSCTEFNCAHRSYCREWEQKRCYQRLDACILKDNDSNIDVLVLDKRSIREKIDPCSERLTAATIWKRTVGEEFAWRLADQMRLYLSDSGKDPKPVAAESPADDVSKQRWIYNPENGCVNPDMLGLPLALFKMAYGTDEVMYVAAAAPEMLDALEKAREAIKWEHTIRDGVSIHQLICNAINKAKGDPNEKNEATETPAK